MKTYILMFTYINTYDSSFYRTHPPSAQPVPYTTPIKPPTVYFTSKIHLST